MAKISKDITLCQPDENKGCCACCGLLNFVDISRENLANYLSSVTNHYNKVIDYSKPYRDNIINPTDIRDTATHICPYQGFIDDGKPGCMLHSFVNKQDMRDLSLFQSEICSDYLCPAHSILNNEQKTMLIEFLDDWYLYTFAIADPESFIWIIEYLKSHFNLSISNRIEDTKLIKDNVFMAMETYLENMIKICEPIYCYSISEYNQFKHLFSLGSNRNEIKRLKEKIKRRVSFDC